MAQQQHTRAQWRRLGEGWAGSGLTQAQYCAHHGVSVASLHRWRELLRREPAPVAAPAQRQRADAPVRLLPVQLLDDVGAQCRPGQAVCLVLADGLRLELAPGFDAPTLQRVVALLQDRAAS